MAAARTCTLGLTAHPDSIEVAVHSRSTRASRMHTLDLNGGTGLLRAHREWIAAYGKEPGAPITPAGLALADPRRGGRGRNRLPDGSLPK
jgi:hypothetical protein